MCVVSEEVERVHARVLRSGRLCLCSGLICDVLPNGMCSCAVCACAGAGVLLVDELHITIEALGYEVVSV
jgi:hypothetical protein